MKSVAVSSGKGGVGKSNVTVNIGLALAQAGKQVLLFDADLGLANIDILFGLSCDHSLIDVVEGDKSLASVLVDAAERMKVLPASSGVLELERLSATQRARIARELKEISADFDVLLIDTAAGLSDNVLFFCAAADEVLVVTTPDPTAITDAYALIKVLTNQHSVQALNLLVNQAADASSAARIHEKINTVCRQFLQREISYWGYLPHDPAVTQAVHRRKPVLLNNPTATISNSFRALAKSFEQQFTAEPGRFVTDFWQMVLAQDDNLEAPRRRSSD